MHPEIRKRRVAHFRGKRDQARAKLRRELATLGDRLESLIRPIDAANESQPAQIPAGLRDGILHSLLQVRHMDPESDVTPELIRDVSRHMMLLSCYVQGELLTSRIERQVSAHPGDETE